MNHVMNKYYTATYLRIIFNFLWTTFSKSSHSIKNGGANIDNLDREWLSLQKWISTRVVLYIFKKTHIFITMDQPIRHFENIFNAVACRRYKLQGCSTIEGMAEPKHCLIINWVTISYFLWGNIIGNHSCDDLAQSEGCFCFYRSLWGTLGRMWRRNAILKYNMWKCYNNYKINKMKMWR